MNQTINNQKYTLSIGTDTLFFDSAEFEGGTQIGKYPLLSKQIDVAIEGVSPIKLTLKGRFLPKDFRKITSFITSNSGKNIVHLIVNNHTYIGMILTDGRAEIKKSEVFGDMALVFQSS